VVLGRIAEYKDEQIIKVGEELEAEGEDVTTSSIRKQLGGGSSTRIKLIWKEFLKKRAVMTTLEESTINVELPPELQSVFEQESEIIMTTLRSYVQKSYLASEALSERKVRARFEEYSNRIERFEKAEDEALAEVDACEEKIALLTDEKKQLISMNDEFKETNAELMGKIKILEENAMKQEAMVIKFESLLKENGRLQYIIDKIDE
jgi:hypothetical protein